MKIQFKDILALVVIVGSFIGIFIDKIPLLVGISIIEAIVFIYLGVKIARR